MTPSFAPIPGAGRETLGLRLGPNGELRPALELESDHRQEPLLEQLGVGDRAPDLDRTGTARFDLMALLVPPEPILPVLLGTLGGAVIDELSISSESARALPLGIEAVSGISPQPF